MKNKKGFTLAEVLITLTVIGVVAAITLPPLIQNYQKHIIVNQLKKSYSTWSQAFQKILADDGVEKLTDTSLWTKLPDDVDCGFQVHPDSCKEFDAELGKYIKIDLPVSRTINEYNEGRLFKNNEYPLRLNDGSIIRYYYFGKQPESWNVRNTETCLQIKALGGTMCDYLGNMKIDVNGNRGPNVLGRDIFNFYFSDNGQIYPVGGKDNALFSSQTELSTNNSYWKNNNSLCNPDKSGNNGMGCAARIMENGWKMDY